MFLSGDLFPDSDREKVALFVCGTHFRADPSLRALHLPHEQFHSVQMTSRKNHLHFVRLHQELPVKLSYVNRNFIYEMLLGQFKVADQYLPQDYEDIDPFIIRSHEKGRRLAVGYISPQLVNSCLLDLTQNP
ncbi:hypothetical protein C0Q44_01305 [Paenibacillus sp. PCH8]|uniref:hypothetical protein n=1 Tax=Paenibacillus sp. PCH8 TaxID=2066524 RepID=UPI000CF8CCA9|nr:hypothetical protein [Paenibacillus sp. PCH8]PQP83386.1 hypothetical protein C0Q44_01305 [Paenibacillus sp. PCH8]